MLNQNIEKQCSTCGKLKPHSEFHKRKASKDGLSPKCKLCAREYDKARANEPHRVLARKEYAKTEGGIEKNSSAKKRYIEENPKKRAAHIAVGNAIRDRKLIKQPCEVCGVEDVQAHHCDYNKPLEVMWLCVKHHVEWHKENVPIV